MRLRDVADVRDGFRDVDLIVRYDGQPAVYVEVYRSANEEVLDVAAVVETYIDEQLLPALPAGVSATVWHNAAEVYEDRLGLLLENGLLGLILVLVTLTLFLEIRVAAWIVVGIAIFVRRRAHRGATGERVDQHDLAVRLRPRARHGRR